MIFNCAAYLFSFPITREQVPLRNLRILPFSDVHFSPRGAGGPFSTRDDKYTLLVII